MGARRWWSSGRNRRRLSLWPSARVAVEQNPDGARFCNACGAALDALPQEVRKTVTVVFADVTGSTALGEQLDPESLRV